MHHHLIELAEEIEKEEYEDYLHEKAPQINVENSLLSNQKDTDEDGLKDFEEKYFGTDLNEKDTDQDGFDDFTEVKKGFNPLGEGLLEENLDLKSIWKSVLEKKESN